MSALSKTLVPLALALALPSIALGSPETVVQKPEEQVILELPVKPGYRVEIVDYPLDGIAELYAEEGEPERLHGRWSGVAFALPTEIGSAENGIQAAFGPIGAVSGSIQVSSQGQRGVESSPPKGCRGKQPLSFGARFTGTIDLHVRHFLRVSTSHANGFVYRAYEMRCKRGHPYRSSHDPADPFSYLPHPVQSFMGIESPILFSSLHHRHRWIEMAASAEAIHKHPSSFRAEALEWLSGGVAAVRWTEASRVSPEFLALDPGRPPRSATLNPPEPFTGTARFDLHSHSLRGDLAVRLPGDLHVRIGSKATHAHVCDLDLRRKPCR